MSFTEWCRVPPPGDSAKAAYDAASPVTQASTRSPPTLLIHGDADDLVPHSQSVTMEAAFLAARVPTRLLAVPGGKHGADFGAGGARPREWPNYYGETVRWFDAHLRGL